jgi:hypothetical protein
MRTARTMLRLIGRVVIVCVVGAFVTLLGLQYARIIGKNVALAHELGGVTSEIHMLQAKRIEQEREIRRLSDPQGAMPEIHDRLHLVSGDQAIIYLKKHERRHDGP